MKEDISILDIGQNSSAKTSEKEKEIFTENKINEIEKEMRPITYLSKLKSMIISRINVSNFDNFGKINISSKLFQSFKSFGKFTKSIKSVKTFKSLKSIKSFKIGNIGSLFKKGKNLISKTHEINHSTEKITTSFLFNFLNKIALLYVLIDSSIKAYKKLQIGYTASFITFSDSLFWHFLASSFIPGVIIHFQKHFLEHFFHHINHFNINI